MPRITSKGQVTIPKRIRDLLGLKPGSDVLFEAGRDGRVVVTTHETEKRRLAAVKERFERALAELRGSAGPGMSTDEVMKLTRGWGEPDTDNR
jgi:antitoxin PrlF